MHFLHSHETEVQFLSIILFELDTWMCYHYVCEDAVFEQIIVYSIFAFEPFCLLLVTSGRAHQGLHG